MSARNLLRKLSSSKLGKMLSPRRSSKAAGSVPAVPVDISDTNVAGIGSDEDKAQRKAAAMKEAAWKGCGQTVGIEVWRIEKFEVVSWPKEKYGSFYEGDSYIVLQTREVKDELGNPKIVRDIFFWLGKETSTDEQGTAAYKTVELDDFFDGTPVQHREVMLHETNDFKALFKTITYLKGGIESGFNHVEPGAYSAKLMQVKKVNRQTIIVEIKCARESLNHGDAFILDAGATIYTWFGDECSPFEKSAANLAAEQLESTRHGAATATQDIDECFWEKLGGEGPIKSKEEAEDVLPKVEPVGEGVLYKLSDATGELSVTEIGRGDLKLSMLTSDDVYLCDPGPELIVWVGRKASAKERASAMSTAMKYLTQQSKPFSTPISVLTEGQPITSPTFSKIFDVPVVA